MWKILCVLALYGLYSAQGVKVTPSQSIFSMAEGSQLQVNCSGQGILDWKKGDSGMPSKAVIKATVNTNGDNISTLTLPQLETSDAGTYRCSRADNNEDSSFELEVFKVKTREAEYEHLKDVSLPCTVDNSSSQDVTYTWKKGDVPVKEIKVEGKQGYEELENGTLVIKHPPRSFAGVYTCVATFTVPGTTTEKTVSVDVNYYATPKVIPFDKSKNLVQDEELVIECRVLGHPKPSVTWFKEGVEIKEGGESRYTLKTANTYNGEPMENSELRLKSVDFDDGGTYTCMATQDKWPQFNSTQEILVRVKDKLAALWPFLGIVAEVVILCTIIFIYEKKRNKDAAEDEDPNQDGATPEKKSEGVRHRGSANNPRA